MAAPTPTARTEPVGALLRNGHRSVITFSINPAVLLWEKTVDPPGIDNGDPIDNTTMWNDDVRTKSPRTISDITDGSLTVGYTPAVLPQIFLLCGKEGVVTVHWPNLATWAAYGYMRSFEPGTLADGEPPEAEVAFTITNWDPVNNVEAKPVYAAPPPPPP